MSLPTNAADAAEVASAASADTVERMLTITNARTAPDVAGNGLLVLPEIATREADSQPVMGTARIDKCGRVADTAFFRQAGWDVGTTLGVRPVCNGVIALRPDLDQARWLARVTQPGQVVLPAPARRLVGLRRGILVVLRLDIETGLGLLVDARLLVWPTDQVRP